MSEKYSSREKYSITKLNVSRRADSVIGRITAETKVTPRANRERVTSAEGKIQKRQNGNKNDKKGERRRDEKRVARETRRDSQGCDKVNSSMTLSRDEQTRLADQPPTNQPANHPT